VNEPAGALFVPPSEPHLLWVAVLAAALPAIALALYALVRGRRPAAASALAMVLLPLFSVVLADLVLMEESKQVSFCGSCHETMGPVVASLEGDAGSLAASHYQRGAVSHAEACYQCHSGYGIWGGVDAKLAGVRHMLHTLRGSYDLPLKLSGSFDVAACLQCHATARGFRAVEAHRDPELQQALLSGGMGCAGVCHAVAHPAEALNGATPRRW
jgi:nitrate/TMAO reductase-like tetraheme cytochrome c subunit